MKICKRCGGYFWSKEWGPLYRCTKCGVLVDRRYDWEAALKESKCRVREFFQRWEGAPS